MPYATVGDVELLYELEGTGPKVLFIGGSGGDLRQRPGVFEGPLGPVATVLAYDQRGLGRSSKPAIQPAMADYGDDAAGLLAAIGWERGHVVGVSFGGMVAQELAIRHPDVVDRLVLCCTSSGGAGGASYPLHELADLDPEERLVRSLAISDTRFDAEWQAANPDKAAKILASMRDRAVENDDPRADEGARSQMEARRHHDTSARLGDISAPTLVYAGRYDGIAPLANGEHLASAIPGARLEVFDGGHMFLLQDSRSWSVMLDFLDLA